MPHCTTLTLYLCLTLLLIHALLLPSARADDADVIGDDEAAAAVFQGNEQHDAPLMDEFYRATLSGTHVFPDVDADAETAVRSHRARASQRGPGGVPLAYAYEGPHAHQLRHRQPPSGSSIGVGASTGLVSVEAEAEIKAYAPASHHHVHPDSFLFQQDGHGMPRRQKEELEVPRWMQKDQRAQEERYAHQGGNTAADKLRRQRDRRDRKTPPTPPTRSSYGTSQQDPL